MDFYAIPLKRLKKELSGQTGSDRHRYDFSMEKYLEVCKAVYGLDPSSRSYYSDLRGVHDLIDENIRLFYNGEIKKNLAIIREAVKREQEDVGLSSGNIQSDVGDVIEKRRKHAKCMLEVGYKVAVE